MVVGIDVGGTFTDVAILRDGQLRSFKTPSTDPQSEAVLTATGSLNSGEGFSFLHGTTVATNALLEETGARVALVTTAGYEDLVEIARQKRTSLYELAENRPVALVSRDHRIGHHDLNTTLERLAELNPEAIAVGLLDSYLDSSEEKALATAIRERFPDKPVSVANEVSPGFREFERISTTTVNAYLAPMVASYLDTIADEIESDSSAVMTSAGGLLPFPAAASFVGQLTLSGPAGGVVATDALRRHHGLRSAISFDMGGTSTDVSRIGPEGPEMSPMQTVGGRVNRIASMPIHTVGAGGGSVAWADPGGSLRVGPQSARSHPGPAAYGQGGVEPTVTDANIFLGYIPTSSSFSGSIPLSRDLAGEALGRLGESLGLSALETAEGILQVVDSHMDGAIRAVSIEEGFDPRGSALVAFGGAGGLHASRLAKGLELGSVLVPPHAGVFSALGLLMAKPRFELLRTMLVDASDPAVSVVGQALEAEVKDAFAEIHGSQPALVDVTFDVRYFDQSHELNVRAAGDLSASFAVAHQQRFGFTLEDGRVEVVNVRATAMGEAPAVWDDLRNSVATGAKPESVEAYLDGQWVEVPYWRRGSVAPGTTLAGPALVGGTTATVLVDEGDRVNFTADGTLQITW